jgi:choloylglycine hydrolase
LATRLLLVLLTASAGLACTAFRLQSGQALVVGRNYDWSVDDGIVLVNKCALAKSALGQQKPVRWVSRYGSVTFNQFGREQPLEGMNSAGLVIATLWLDETALPEGETLPTVNPLQWVQYQLDVSASVAEVLRRDSALTIAPGAGSTVHFFVADSAGNSAVVEYLGGRRVHRLNPRVRAITNNRYTESESTLAGLTPFGGTGAVPTDFGSLARFDRAALYLQRFNPADSIAAVDYSFALLSAVSLGMSTKWSLVYDIGQRRVWFRTQRNQSLRRIDLREMDFAGTSPVMMLEYTTAANRALIFKVFREVEFLRDVPDQSLEALARYPETLRWVGNE